MIYVCWSSRDREIASYRYHSVEKEAEISDILLKLLKNEDEQTMEDDQLLCNLWSGEGAGYYFSTLASRQIDEGTPFCILEGTQIQNAKKILARIDQGHGLVDRFLVAIPVAFRPTPQEQEDANTFLSSCVIKDFSKPIFSGV